MPLETYRGHAQTDSASPRSGQRRLAVLSCPICGHESPVDGDWVEVSADEGVHVGEGTLAERSVEIRCPDCYERLTSRPRE